MSDTVLFVLPGFGFGASSPLEAAITQSGARPAVLSSCVTALAEAEVEYEDHTSTSVYVKFPVTDGGTRMKADGNELCALQQQTDVVQQLGRALSIAREQAQAPRRIINISARRMVDAIAAGRRRLLVEKHFEFLGGA